MEATSLEGALQPGRDDHDTENEVARRLYTSRGFREMAVFRGYEGSPGWRPGEALPPGNVSETTPRELVPVYRTGHSWQKRPQVLERLTGFRAMRYTAPGDPAYIVFDRRGPILYVFDLTPNEVGRALLERIGELVLSFAQRLFRIRQIAVLNT